MAAEPEPKHIRLTYNQVHNIIKRTAKEIAEFKPDVLLAIGKNSNI
jgi:hypoxanthine phosphoribosyltransferase